MHVIPSQNPVITDSLAVRVSDRQVGGIRVLTLVTPVQSVVSWRGAFMAFPRFVQGEEVLQELAVMMLDRGTLRRDRFAVAEVLENRGAQLLFSSTGLRVTFHGHAIREDVPEVLRVMAEQLREPLFDPMEFEKVKAQYKAALQRSLENTGSQASGALSRRLYSPAHPNYAPPAEEVMEKVTATTLEQVQAYYQTHFGARDLLMVFVGDVEGLAVETVVEETLGHWPTHEVPSDFAIAAQPQPVGNSQIFLPGKQNIDVYMGHALSVRRKDPAYMPLFLANYILGGNFSARLMHTVRDEMGLTYGIHARLVGITSEYEGHWQVGVTLSQDLVQKGIEATREVVTRFVEEGPTPEELSDKKTTLTGSYKVGLATTGGLASSLYINAIRGFDVAYLDHYPQQIEAITLEEVSQVMQEYFHPDTFQMALAGSIPEVVL